MAPLTRRQKKALAAAAPPRPPPPAIDPADPVIDPNDRISRLPPEIQAHILSFLEAQVAVRTCVLARTWRNVWKTTRRLLITAGSVQETRQFVDRLLRVRLNGLKDASLDASEIRLCPYEEVEDGDDMSEGYYLDGEDISIINRWIRRVLKCRIQTLRIEIDTCGSSEGYLEMGSMPLLVSLHLTRLELTGVFLICDCINLDGCPALEHLEIKECQLLGVRKIVSQSLKRLVITSCDSNHYEKRIRICVPRLQSLCLDNTCCPASEHVRTPLLGRMPELVGAELRISSFADRCYCDDPMACYHVMRDGDTSDIDSGSEDDEEGSCDYGGRNTTKCVVLEGLAQARDLVLIADLPTYIFRRDLRWCPTFSNLKTLVLIEEYKREPADCSVIECMLQHAPLLEKLTFTLRKVPARDGKYKVEIKGYRNAKLKSTKISQHLKMVKINCEAVNGIFSDVLKFLCTLNMCFETTVTEK